MRRNFVIISVILFILDQNAISQDFIGSFQVKTEQGTITLIVQGGDKDTYTGTLTGNGNIFHLQGKKQGVSLTGTVGDELDGLRFQADLQGNHLSFTMFESNDQDNPLPGTAQTFIFQRILEMQEGSTETISAKNGTVIINDVKLSNRQLKELENTYGIKPQPGNYWYDVKSGLYGVVGYPSYGFMFPDHNFGQLNRNASNGNSGIIVNGRELPQSEWTIWSYMLGYWIQAGSYWLDHNGNAGYEGSSVALVNLFVAAQQNAYRGKGGSGDNFWSSRFSAGNYDSGNQRGYVSVPGYGPVGYGF
jgi:hypothetical protein